MIIVAISIFATKKIHGYGYKRNQDPLIQVFKAIVFYGKEENWPKVISEVKTIHDRFLDIQRLFHIDMEGRIMDAIRQQDLQELVNQAANLVFLAIREKFYYNRNEKLEIFLRAKVRLRLAEEYYNTLLAGNVRNYDIRHNTSLHETIFQMFKNARTTLGSLGFFGAGSVKPDLNEFNSITTKIEALLLQAFPYFEKGQAVPDE